MSSRYTKVGYLLQLALLLSMMSIVFDFRSSSKVDIVTQSNKRVFTIYIHVHTFTVGKFSSTFNNYSTWTNGMKDNCYCSKASEFVKKF